MRIHVGSPILTINHGSTFMVTDLSGQVNSEGHFGIFTNDTRFLSYYGIYADGHSWKRLTSTTPKYYAARIYLTNSQFTASDGAIAENTLSLVISRVVEQGIQEELELTNYGQKRVSFNLEIALRSDFADIFEVESRKFVRRGRIETKWDAQKQQLSTSYTNGDFYRCLIYQPYDCTSQLYYANGRISFEIKLDAGQKWQTNCKYILIDNNHVREPINLTYNSAINPDTINTEIERLHGDWTNCVTDITFTHSDIQRLYRQSIEDIGALRLYDYDAAPDVWIPAAGVPKFVTLFGRDSLIVSLQNMIVHPGFARGALQKLAQLQATAIDDWRDAQPGKILHEIRTGELAYLQQIPHTPYYGTADATPLFLILLHETWKWLGDISLLQEYRDVARRCLEWIDHYGDLDGDGFQEYHTRSPHGIENMGWKDSGDAIVYPDGSQVKAPKALCELQGYAFDARMRMAEVFAALGEKDFALELQTKAAKLQTQFEASFWCEDIAYYAFSLDPDKKPVKTIASNQGHCLWSGIISPERAQHVAARLLAPDMSSGWGIRTLSAQNPAYNPFSYHRGSVWPHDNSIIALGLKRYGFAQEVAIIAHDIFTTAGYFSSDRLPELYSGTTREIGAFPVPYIEANVPQAWAAGSVFQLLQAMLGLRADAPHHKLYVDPYLPAWLPDITLRRLQVGNAQVDLQFWREGEITRWEATPHGEVTVEAQPWQPWVTTTQT